MCKLARVYVAVKHTEEEKRFTTLSSAQRWLDKAENPTGFRYFGDDTVIIVRHRTFEDRSLAYRC
jgi:hypothetical protein